MQIGGCRNHQSSIEGIKWKEFLREVVEIAKRKRDLGRVS